ncbi:MAG: DUF89 domain-containing protein [Thermoplasmata archaeon]
MMKIRPECFPCLLRRSLYETNLVNPELGYDAMKAAADALLLEFGENANSAEVATKVHRVVYDLLGTDDPYKEVKKKSNEVAQRLYPRAEELVRGSDDPFRAAVTCSIAGNVLDFGIRTRISGPEGLEPIFEKIYTDGLGHDDTPRIKEILAEADEVLIFGDNAGEIVFDRLLVRELKKFGGNVTYVVRGRPILTDATLEDALEFGMDELADEVLTTNAFAVGVDFNRLDDALRRKLDQAGLTICKGMANWESFSDQDYRPIAYLVHAKCRPVAESMGVPLDRSSAKLFE